MKAPNENKRISFLRKKYLINPKFQYKFMGFVVLAIIFSMSIVYISNLYFFDSFIEKGQALNLEADHPFFLIIQEQKEFMMKIFLGVSSIISLCVGIWGLFFSHRIAGPLYRLNKVFKDATNAKTKVSHIEFRKSDFFQEIPVVINEYLDKIESEEEGEKRAS